MYRVYHQDKVSEEFRLFVDAWLYARLECSSFSYIVGEDGMWMINPAETN